MRINDKENYKKISESISMKNLKTIIESKGFTYTKVAMGAKVTPATINAYISGNKIPSLPTLISLSDYLNCNIDYLLDRTNNSININDIDKLSTDEKVNQLIQNITSLPKNQQLLVEAFIKGLNSKDN